MWTNPEWYWLSILIKVINVETGCLFLFTKRTFFSHRTPPLWNRLRLRRDLIQVLSQEHNALPLSQCAQSQSQLLLTDCGEACRVSRRPFLSQATGRKAGRGTFVWLNWLMCIPHNLHPMVLSKGMSLFWQISVVFPACRCMQPVM